MTRKRKKLTITVSYPAMARVQSVRNHVGAAINWWQVKVLPEVKLDIRMIRCAKRQ